MDSDYAKKQDGGDDRDNGRDDREPTGPHAVVLVVEEDEGERTRLREIVGALGCVVVALPTVAGAIALLANGALCDLIILDIDSLGDDAGLFDRLLSVRTPHPAIIVCGVDRETKLVLHCLNRGASDFLAKPAAKDDLVKAVYNAVAAADDVARPVAADDAIHASSHVAGWIELTSSSELEHFRRLQRFSDALFATHLPRDVVDDLKMAIEEVGRNAVEWGNNFNPDKRVHVSYCMFSDRIVIKVEDEGEGFVPDNVPDPTQDPVKTMRDRQEAGKRPGGYGVFLLNKLVDNIVYNEKGNAVLLIKYLPEKT